MIGLGPRTRRRLALIGMLMAPGVEAETTDPAATVIARADSVTVTVGDLRHLLDSLQPEQRKQVLADQGQVTALIEGELGRRLLLATAHKEHWEKRPAVAAAISAASAEIIIGSYLKAHATAETGYPPEAESRRVYDADLKRFMQPRQYHLAQIFVALPEHADAAAIAATASKARMIAAEAARPGADFAALAKSRSDDSHSAGAGGDLGWLSESSLIPAIQVAVQGLTEGSTSDPIAARDGWHILHEIATRPAAPRPFDEVRPAIEASLRRQQEQTAAERFVGGLLTKGNAAINAAVLSRFIGATP